MNTHPLWLLFSVMVMVIAGFFIPMVPEMIESVRAIVDASLVAFTTDRAAPVEVAISFAGSLGFVLLLRELHAQLIDRERQ